MNTQPKEWTLALNDKLGKRIVSYPGNESFWKYARLKAGRRTLVLKADPRPGSDGDLLRVRGRLGLSAESIKNGKPKEIKEAKAWRFRIYWLAHSLKGLILVMLVAGTVLTGEVGIRTTVTGAANAHLAWQAWLGLALSALAILLSTLREIFADD